MTAELSVNNLKSDVIQATSPAGVFPLVGTAKPRWRRDAE